MALFKSTLVYIKYPKCGKVYRCKSDGNNDIDRIIQCQCGEEIKISFSGICTSCDKRVGFAIDFNWGKFTGEMISNFIDSMIKPIESINRFTRIFKYPSAKAYGNCPFCNKLYLLCPECKTAVHMRKDQENDIITCPNCGCKMQHP